METPVVPVETPSAVAPAPPGRPGSLLPTDKADPLHAAYFDENHAEHRQAVQAVHARFQAAHGGPAPWRADALENPGVLDPTAPFLLLAPHPGPWPSEDQRAVSNVFGEIAGSKTAAQQALDWVADGPAANPPDLPASYTPPDREATVAELRRGWGAQADENLHLAQRVIDVLDAQKNGELRAYLERTRLGDDVRVIRLAARTARQWIKQGWRP